MSIGGSSAPAGQRGRVVWAGGAAAGVALLQFLQKGVEAVHLSSGVFWLLSALIVVAGLGIGQWHQVQARRDASRASDAALDEALACWPPRPVSSFTPHDVGVHPRLDVPPERSPYIARDADAALREAIDEDALAVVFGPAGAGKSRSAFEAVRRHANEAILLMPEDAKGLRALVAQTPAAVVERGTRAVLWIEGLDGYLEGLDVDGLMRFLHWTEDSSSVVLVATIRDDALDRLLESADRDGFVIRRLLTHGRGVFVSGEFSDAELAEFERHHGRRPETRDVAAAFPQNWRAGWLRCSTAPAAEPGRSRRQFDGPTAVLATLFAILLVAAGIVGERYGWTDAPPISDQVRALADDVRPCQRLQAYPAGGAGIEQASDPTAQVLVAIVSGADCLESDEVRFYRRGSDDRLKRIGSLRPADPATRLSFDCIGLGATNGADAGVGSCHVTLRGGATSIVGAFRDGETQQELPVVVSFGPEGLRLRALSLPERSVPAFNQRPMTVRLVSSSGSAGTAADGVCREDLGCLSGRTAAAVAVVPRSARTPSVLLTGYARGGVPQAPDSVRVRVWKIDFSGDEARRGRDCLVLVQGRPRRALIRNPVLSELRAELAARWRPQRADVMC